MNENKLKISLDIMWVDLKGNLALDTGTAKLNIHYYSGDGVNVCITGLPDKPVELIINKHNLLSINEFLLKIVK